jgi:hypothetical protein
VSRRLANLERLAYRSGVGKLNPGYFKTGVNARDVVVLDGQHKRPRSQTTRRNTSSLLSDTRLEGHRAGSRRPCANAYLDGGDCSNIESAVAAVTQLDARLRARRSAGDEGTDMIARKRFVPVVIRVLEDLPLNAMEGNDVSDLRSGGVLLYQSVIDVCWKYVGRIGSRGGGNSCSFFFLLVRLNRASFDVATEWYRYWAGYVDHHPGTDKAVGTSATRSQPCIFCRGAYSLKRLPIELYPFSHRWHLSVGLLLSKNPSSRKSSKTT